MSRGQAMKDHVDCRYFFTDQPSIHSTDDERRKLCCALHQVRACADPKHCDQRMPVGPMLSPVPPPTPVSQ